MPPPTLATKVAASLETDMKIVSDGVWTPN